MDDVYTGRTPTEPPLGGDVNVQRANVIGANVGIYLGGIPDDFNLTRKDDFGNLQVVRF